MDKRLHERKSCNLKAEIVYDSQRYRGVIKNISEEGLFKVVISEDSVLTFIPGKVIDIHLDVPSKEPMVLRCEIKWIRIQKNSPLYLKYNLGIQAHDPPRAYKEFTQSL